LIFDVNDFDETLPGPWEWDLKRLGASFAVAARSKGIPDEVGKAAVLRMTLSYANLLAAFATTPTLDAWYWSIDTEFVGAMAAAVGDAETQRIFDQAIARAHAHNNLQAVNKLTAVVDGHRRIVDQPPLVCHVGGDGDLDRMQSLLDGYRASLPDDVGHLLDRFTLADAARKVVGVGSVGTRCWIALLQGGPTTRSSSRSRKHKLRCSSHTSGAPPTTTTPAASSSVSGSCKPPTTCSWVGPTTRLQVPTTTGATCVT
jgi:uncharacterized protein (DUF2252 family)